MMGFNTSAMFSWFLCKIGRHDLDIDEMGGIIFECCKKCNWVGRAHDIFRKISISEELEKMSINLKDLKVGDIVVTGDSYGYYLVEITKSWYKNEDLGPKVIEIECKDLKTKEISCLGYCEDFSAYAPNFWSYEDWINSYPPEAREGIKKEYGI